MNNIIVLAGGKSSRMGMNKNKVLLKCCGENLINIMLKEINDSCIGNCIVVLGYDANNVHNTIKYNANCVIQKEINGTGGAVHSTMHLIDNIGYSLIINGDGPFLSSMQFKNIFNQINNYDMLLLTHIDKNKNNFGRIVRDKNNNIKEIVEVKNATSKQLQILECNSGVYIIKSSVLKEFICDIKINGITNEKYFTDIVKILYKNNKKIGNVNIDKNNYLPSVNTLLEFEQLNKKLQLQINDNLLNNRVKLIDKNNTYVDINCTINLGCELYPNVYICNNSVIGENTIIYPNCFINNCIIGSNCVIGANSVLQNITLQDNTKIEPFFKLIKI